MESGSIDITFNVNESYGVNIMEVTAGTFPMSFNGDEVDRVLR